MDDMAESIIASLEREDAYFRKHMNEPDGPEPCYKAGHVPGCPGRAGGDHELLPGWISYEENGFTFEVEITTVRDPFRRWADAATWSDLLIEARRDRAERYACDEYLDHEAREEETRMQQDLEDIVDSDGRLLPRGLR